MEIALDRKLCIDVKSTPSSAVIRTITDGIEEGSASLSQVLWSEENLTFGSYNSSKFEVTLYGADVSVNQYIQVYIERPSRTAIVGEAITGTAIVGTDEDSDTRTYLFSGYIESIQRGSRFSQDNYVRIIAYDALYFLKEKTTLDAWGTTISAWWTSIWSSDLPNKPNPVSLGVIRNAICRGAGLTLAPAPISGQPDDYHMVNEGMWTFPQFEHYGGTWDNTYRIIPLSPDTTFSQMLTWIGEVQCFFPHINEIGKLEFVDIWEGRIFPPPTLTTHDIVDKYELDTSEFDDDPSTTVSQVAVYMNGEKVHTSGTYTNGNVYPISDNLILNIRYSLMSYFGEYYNPELDVRQICGRVTDVLNYYQASIHMICSDLSIKLGDRVIFYREDSESSEQHTEIARVSGIELSGPLLVEQTIESQGKNRYDLESTSSSSSPTFVADSLNLQVLPHFECNDSYGAVSVANSTSTDVHTNLCSFTLPKGLWVVQAAVQFSANNNGLRTIWFSGQNNGDNNMGIRFFARQNAAGSNGLTIVQLTTIMKITQPSRTLYLVGQQNSGAQLTAYPRIAFFGNKEN